MPDVKGKGDLLASYITQRDLARREAGALRFRLALLEQALGRQGLSLMLSQQLLTEWVSLDRDCGTVAGRKPPLTELAALAKRRHDLLVLTEECQSDVEEQRKCPWLGRGSPRPAGDDPGGVAGGPPGGGGQ